MSSMLPIKLKPSYLTLISAICLTVSFSSCEDRTFKGNNKQRSASVLPQEGKQAVPLDPKDGDDPVDVSEEQGVQPNTPGANPPGDNTPGDPGIPGTDDPDLSVPDDILEGTKPKPGDTDENGTDLETNDTIYRGFFANCHDDKTKVAFSGPLDTEAVAEVTGELCPATTARLTVAFVVDFSGSMGKHVRDLDNPQSTAGNDPQVNGDCGRLQAAQAVIDQISKQAREQDDVKIAMLPFAGGIISSRVLRPTAMKEFKNKLNADTFCSYVVQEDSMGYHPENPGGLQRGEADPSTNYKAAFEGLESLFASVDGRKIVYFISDGEPTTGGEQPTVAGIQAGEQFRNNVANVTLNALLLGESGEAAQQILEQVAGSAERVRKAALAGELAEKILEFPEASINTDTAVAELKVPGYEPRIIKLESLKKKRGSEEVWEYRTERFVLQGLPGEVVSNQVTVTADGVDGSRHQSGVIINYRQEP